MKSIEFQESKQEQNKDLKSRQRENGKRGLQLQYMHRMLWPGGGGAVEGRDIGKGLL
jgi:hypothetical protein